jgi:hypothetical protein
MKKILLMADVVGGNGSKKSSAKTVKVRNISAQPINVDGNHLPAAVMVKGKVAAPAPVVEISDEHRARLGELVEDAE